MFSYLIKRSHVLFFFGILLSVLGIVYFNNPNENNSILPECVFHKYTGLYCTGCGITRATYSLLHLDIAEALRQNLLIILVIPLFFLLLFYPKISRLKYFPHTIFFIILIFTILRNIEYFSFLAPY